MQVSHDPRRVFSQLVSIQTLLAFAMACIAVIVLRRTEPTLGVLVCMYLMVGLPLARWLRLVVWLAIGLAIYVGYGRRSAARRRVTAAPAIGDAGGEGTRVAV